MRQKIQKWCADVSLGDKMFALHFDAATSIHHMGDWYFYFHCTALHGSQ
jgi:hypothetical protein